MKSTGKISNLPAALRDEVNQRLDRAEPAETILAWLNAQPEVKQRTATLFRGKPVSKQNLFEYKTHSFRAWRMRDNAARFTETLAADGAGLEDADSESVTDSLVQWLGIRYLALAQAVADTPAENPQAELKRLRKLSRDILELRRSQRLAARVKLAEKRYELTHEMAVHNGHIADPNPPPEQPYQPYPDALDLARWRVFGTAVEPLLEHPEYEHPACII